MKKKKLALIITAVVILLVGVTSCYAKGPWRGKVIDAETKQPIEGAAVVAVFTKKSIAPTGGMIVPFDARETVTDKNGEFEIPKKWYLSIPYLREVQDPHFIVYKPGYGIVDTRYYTDMELTKVLSKKEREQAIRENIGDLSRGKYPYLMKLINEERKYLGYEPLTGE